MAFKKIQTHQPKPAETEPSFRKVSLPPVKQCMIFPAHLWIRKFWPQIYFLILASMKWAGPRIPKGQLSRVPWLGNAWMSFTFQPTLRVLQQPHKHSHSLQLATHTELAHHYIQ